LAEKVLSEEQTPLKAWLAGVVGWAVPGAGHLLLGRYGRGLLLGGVVWVLFILGLTRGGHLFGPSDADTGLLAYVFGFFDLGMGALYFVATMLGVGVAEQSSNPTSEYGNVFFMIAGLLNYLLALDAFDIGARRKS
jgi:hypothetical protein